MRFLDPRFLASLVCGVLACSDDKSTGTTTAGDTDTPAADGDTSGPDVEPPTWPQGTTLALSPGGTDVALSWPAAIDDIEVTAYRVYNGEEIAVTLDGATTQATITDLAEGTAYEFRIEAGDAADNWSSDGPTGSTTTTLLPADPATVVASPDPTEVAAFGDSLEFLFTGDNPIQQGVAAGTIKKERIAVFRGAVKARDGAPISGVTVSVLNHPELGTTLTRSDGQYDLAVNGGGLLTLVFKRSGFLPAHRTRPVPWRQYARVAPVVLVPLDATVTRVVAGSTQPQIARGSLIQDDDGQRRATLYFPAGVSATAALPDGATAALNELHVRATEYTVGDTGPQAMPAPLPPSSGYTYAVELSVDEALDASAPGVSFDKPVVLYVDDFIGFPVGAAVPVGTYDTEQAAWVAMPNGKVLMIIDTAGGKATVDSDGDGAPDSGAVLAELGIDDAELEVIATAFAPETKLWRVPTTHFSTVDCNWPVLPNGAKPPNQSNPQGQGNQAGDCHKKHSDVQCANQVLGEDLRIVGTPFALHYGSDRAAGNLSDYTVAIPVSSDSVPEPLLRIDMVVEVAGLQFTESFQPEANQTKLFTWDGVDAYGRSVQGAQHLSTALGYVYTGQYGSAEESAASFGGVGTTDVEYNSARGEFTLWQSWSRTVGNSVALPLGLGGWTLSVHHVYDPNAGILFRGDGERTYVEDLPNVVHTFAGGGTNGDGWPADEARLALPTDVAVAPDGSVYVAESAVISRIDPDGIISTVVGKTGSINDGIKDGQAALSDQLVYPTGVAVAEDGTIYIAERGERRIRTVDPEGIIWTLAGSARPESAGSGDGGLAIEARLEKPSDVAIGPDGIYFTDRLADSYEGVVRKVGTDGIIHRIAGGGTPEDGIGDGGAALDASLDRPEQLAFGPNGELFVVDFGHGRVRRIDPDGSIGTVAGSNNDWEYPDGGVDDHTFWGDGGPATAAKLYYPYGIAVGADGTLFVSEAGGGYEGDRVRRISPDGIISLRAGSGAWPESDADLGDGLPAPLARFLDPRLDQ